MRFEENKEILAFRRGELYLHMNCSTDPIKSLPNGHVILNYILNVSFSYRWTNEEQLKDIHNAILAELYQGCFCINLTLEKEPILTNGCNHLTTTCLFYIYITSLENNITAVLHISKWIANIVVRICTRFRKFLSVDCFRMSMIEISLFL